MSRRDQAAMPDLSAEGTQSSNQTQAEHTVKILLCGGRAAHAATRQSNDKACEPIGEFIARQFGLPSEHEAPSTGYGLDTGFMYHSRQCQVKTAAGACDDNGAGPQPGNATATLFFTTPMAVEDLLHPTGGDSSSGDIPSLLLDTADVLILIVSVNARSSFDSLAQISRLQKKTPLSEASRRNPELRKFILVTSAPQHEPEVSHDEAQSLADALGFYRLLTAMAGDVEQTTALLEDVAGEVIADRRARDASVKPCAPLLAASTPPSLSELPLSSQVAIQKDAQIGHEGLKNGEWVRKIFGRN
ncbi:Ras-related and estrogen-regulated growth inhibitor [Microdochium nivale]|nr:Ras-related and estrogen-regulated growth inhibitor [Microdochium nivale]